MSDMWYRIRVPTAALAALAVAVGVLAAAAIAAPGVAERFSLSPPILVVMTIGLAWITFLARLRDASSNDESNPTPPPRTDGNQEGTRR